MGKDPCRFGESKNVLDKNKSLRKNNVNQKAILSTGMKKYYKGGFGDL